MAHRVRRPLVAGVMAAGACFAAALPAFASSSTTVDLAGAAWSNRVSVSVTYTCSIESTAALLPVDVVDVSALAFGSDRVTPTCDGLGHTVDVFVGMADPIPLFSRSVALGDRAFVSVSLVDGHGQVVDGATDTAGVSLR